MKKINQMQIHIF